MKIIKLLSIILSFNSCLLLSNELIEAAKKEDIVKENELLKQGFDVNSQDEEGNTSLLIVASKPNVNSEAFIKLLLNYEANINIKNNEGQTVCLAGAKSVGLSYNERMNIRQQNLSLLELEQSLVNNKPFSVFRFFNITLEHVNMNTLTKENLIWFLNRVLKKNKEHLLSSEYIFIVKTYRNIKQGNLSLIDLVTHINYVQNEIIKLRPNWDKNKIIAYQKLANDIFKILYLYKVDISINKNTLKDNLKLKVIKEKILNSQDIVLPWDIAVKIALEYN